MKSHSMLILNSNVSKKSTVATLSIGLCLYVSMGTAIIVCDEVLACSIDCNIQYLEIYIVYGLKLSTSVSLELIITLQCKIKC